MGAAFKRIKFVIKYIRKAKQSEGLDFDAFAYRVINLFDNEVEVGSRVQLWNDFGKDMFGRSQRAELDFLQFLDFTSRLRTSFSFFSMEMTFNMVKVTRPASDVWILGRFAFYLELEKLLGPELMSDFMALDSASRAREGEDILRKRDPLLYLAFRFLYKEYF
ncbi:hypothetical protein M6B38_144080 [Iris pallida]|uniref:Uncharacterized protein n=1 Tax=Iris pallida TaxID=29817 RepID=A0AAX6FB67_IRIPA|nr:hypothetical protein M6B38_144080 [Iris pallida]